MTIISFSSFMLIALTLLQISCPVSAAYIFPCYYVYEPWVISPETLPMNICTHIILAGCIDEQYLIAETHNRPINCSIGLRKVSNLKNSHPNVKFLVSMATNVTAMHTIVQNATLQDAFVNSVVALLTEYNYDGVDFDWEFPCLVNDRFLFTKLLQKLRSRLSHTKLITAAIGAPIEILQKCYDLPGLVENLDFINVMCYNYNTIYNKRTAYSSPLYARPEEQSTNAALLNTNSTILYMLAQNVPRGKIVVGMGLDGHTFQLADKNINGFNAKVLGTGYSRGWAAYTDLCWIEKNGGRVVYDELASVAYAVYEDQWTNAGDPRMASDKAKWVRKYGLAGMFTWCLNIDDISNVCGHNVTFPVHRTIHNVLFNRNST